MLSLFVSSVLGANIVILIATVISCIRTVKITHATTKTCEEITQRLDHIKKLRS